MIKDDRNYHQRLQEFCDCYMETDPKKELEKASKEFLVIPAETYMNWLLNFLVLESFMEPLRRPRRFP